MIKRIFSVFLLAVCLPLGIAHAQTADESQAPTDDTAVVEESPDQPEESLPEEALPPEEPIAEDQDPIDEPVTDPTTETVETPEKSPSAEQAVTTDETGEKLNGTLSDEDPDNQTPDKVKEKNLFGSDEADPEDDGEGPMVSDYTFKMEFNTRAVFADKISGIPYMEINYTNKIEVPIEVSTKKKKAEAKMESTAEVTGTLSQNELYRCELQINMLETKAQIQTRHIKIEEKDDKPGESTLAVQIKFPKKTEEEWISDCLATDGSKMKTQGDSEYYDSIALEAITPDLTGITFEDYDTGDSAKVDLYAEQTEVDDFDTNNYITITGSGTLEIEYGGGTE